MDQLFDAAGTLRVRYESIDWTATPLGPVASWSTALRSAVALALHSRFPVTLFWGPDLTLIYNEAYVEMIGAKHPSALGAPVATIFPEIWDTIGPMLHGVISTGEATMAEDLRLMMDRHGFLEETYFTFCYSAVVGESGDIEGVIDIATETTGRILAHRRLAALARLTDALSEATTDAEIVTRATEVLAGAADDLPEFAVRLSPPPAAAAVAGGAESLGVAPSSGGSTPMRDARIIRIPLSADAGHPYLDVRLSDHLPVDDEYRGFLRLIAAALTQAFTRVRQWQAERRLAELEHQMSEALQLSLLTAPARPEDLDVAVRYRSAAEQTHVGGDWYDSFLLPDGSLALVVGDVSGHDRHAAAVMAQMRNLLRGVAYDGDRSPAQILTTLDAAMRGLRVGSFATAILARVEHDENGHRLRWSNAGHPPPVLIPPDGPARLLTTPVDILLGLGLTGAARPAPSPADSGSPRSAVRAAGNTRRDHVVGLPPGSVVVLYTDGLVERRGQIIDAGLADLTDTLTAHAGRSVEDLCDLLLDRFADSEDDIALVILRIPATAPVSAPTPAAGGAR
ncbi:PP2C family protein-serine/threonine phosphatase [Actinoplanes sp. NBRC 101535]|uniref:PP2C family protein-serine/threonine phosphatase n=1 Tax=Actinoplanes sp. NBRC 101535 TaxID=3032196 RepID=UPI0024A3ACB8|nr:PP2C family protein-serine/threonine phosphatase [Actinoplanes sp. NBRC 101535]GLY06773.1 hypothetical protein Acsp01_71520 [Actinoplanes sp. NBRC 101535]